MQSHQSELPFPKNTVRRLFKNPLFRHLTVKELKEFEECLRQRSDNCEFSAIQAIRHQVVQIQQRIMSKRQIMEQLNPQTVEQIEEFLKLHEEIEVLKALKFVTEMSACMSISTNQNALNSHKNASLVTKHMFISSSCFKVSPDGKVQRSRRETSIAKWDPIPEDFIVT